MESHPKVMTVSYGTFACTLEGFDDPFTTMQLVAEYFRKLSAEDRYFGGEPLQPDTNTLHRIARDANPNKVDAEVSDGGVILRQADVVDAPAKAAPIAAKAVDTPKDVAPKRAASQNNQTAKTPDSFVEDAVFTSRRAALVPAAHESARPVAEVLREEEGTAVSAVTTPEGVQQAVKQVADTIAKAAEPKRDTLKLKKVSRPAQPLQTKTKVAPPRDYKPVLTPKSEAKEEADSPVVSRAVRLHELRQTDDIQREEEALERLLETTNTKLSAPAHARRSNALERLKAAVVATEAERRLRGGAKTSRPKIQDLGGDPDAFKKELKSVRTGHEDKMKITRPVLKRDGAPRRRAAVATLILDNEQRVESVEASATAEVKKSRALSR